MKWLRRLFYLIVILAVIAVPPYYLLVMESHMPSSGSYSIDMAEVRRLADSIPGDKPQEIRVETIAHLAFPRTAIMAGDTWENDDMPISSYQLVYPDHTAIIDTPDRRTGAAVEDGGERHPRHLGFGRMGQHDRRRHAERHRLVGVLDSKARRIGPGGRVRLRRQFAQSR